MANQERYNVYCPACGVTHQPLLKTPLWWQAKKRADQGYLDALCISAKKCGCEKQVAEPNAPFRVFGYDAMCEDFDIPFQTFTDAVRTFIKLNSTHFDVVFIQGVSESVQARLLLL